ncbi:MAG: diacylglycerol/lipid kinase family protein [Ardenticatenaceae bacterium]
MKTIIIVNPHAASGRALWQFRQLEPLLSQAFDDFHVAVTSHPAEVAQQIALAAEAGYDTILSAGGDGTNLAVVNALAQRLEHGFTLATLPLGTGRDWARTLGIPPEPEAALQWLMRAEARPIDIGRVTADGMQHFFLNVASAGLSGEVGRRVNAAPVKRPWTYLGATISTLLQFGATAMRVSVDDIPTYEGGAILLAVGNGRFFGRGMMVCPDAHINDGLLDVVIVESMGKVKVLTALGTLYKGTHIEREDVHVLRGRRVTVEALGPPVGIELDGDSDLGSHTSITYEIVPGALRMLVDPSVGAVAS